MAEPRPSSSPVPGAAPQVDAALGPSDDNGSGDRARIPLGTMLAYGPPIFGLSAMLFFVQFFFLKFATDFLLIAPAVVGAVFALGRLWDAITDPVVGTWSDRTRARLGRRRPWMLVGIPLLALTFASTYSPPANLAGVALVAWVTVGLFGFYSALTVYIVPHQAMGAELTTDHHDRSRIFGLRHAFFTLGMISAFAGIQFVNNADEPRAAAGLFVIVTGVLFSLLLLVPLRVRERADYQGRGAESSFRAMADVLRNPHARRLLFVQFIEMSGAGVLGVLSPFIMQYVLKRPDLIATMPAVFVGFSILSIPMWVRLSRRFGKRNVWVVAMVGFGASFGLSGFVQPGQWLVMALLLVSAGISSGCGGAIGPSILADVIDYDEYVSGERKEGAYSAAWGFAIKAGNAVIILVAGVALQLSGFEPNAEQSWTAELTLRGLWGGLPFLMFGTGALLFRRFSLDEHEHARIRRELDQRRRAAAG